MSDFHERMHAAGIHGLWELASKMTKHPAPKAVAHMWPAALLEALVREAGEVVPIGEERRALQLFNPGLDGQWATTNTMIAAIQLLLPGEVARAHRHTPTAIRFIMEGEGAYTAVVAAAPLLMGEDVAVAVRAARRPGRPARRHRPRVHPPADGAIAATDDGLLGPAAPPRRAFARASPHRQRCVLRRPRRGRDDHRRLPLRVGPGRRHRAAVLGAPRAREHVPGRSRGAVLDPGPSRARGPGPVSGGSAGGGRRSAGGELDLQGFVKALPSQRQRAKAQPPPVPAGVR